MFNWLSSFINTGKIEQSTIGIQNNYSSEVNTLLESLRYYVALAQNFKMLKNSTF